MVAIKVNLTHRAFDAVVARAISERRSVPDQVEVLLQAALGLPYPIPPERREAERCEPAQERAA